MAQCAKKPARATAEGPTPIRPVVQPVEVERDFAYAAAKGVVGERFPNERAAMQDPEFKGADINLVKEYVITLRRNEETVRLCKEKERVRRKLIQMEVVAANPEAVRTNFDFQESQFNDLMRRYGSRVALVMTDEQRRLYAWSFEQTAVFDKRYYAWQFQYAVLADLAEQTQGAYIYGGRVLQAIAEQIFGASAYCYRSVVNAVKESRPEQQIVGRPVSFPREHEAVVFRFVSCCRKHNIAMYKSTIICHAQRLLDGTESALAFVLVLDDGEYATDEEGRLIWDKGKWDNWYAAIKLMVLAMCEAKISRTISCLQVLPPL